MDQNCSNNIAINVAENSANNAVSVKEKTAIDNSKKVLITPKFLKDHCRKNDLYMTPRLNDVLYLHHKGFTHISNLEEYTGLKTLWLENNSISIIENIAHLTDLRCLFLQDNKIQEISNLESLTKLTNLNLASNFITKIEGLRTLVNLHTLVLTGNKLKFTQDVEELRECQSISVLELCRNCLSEYGVIDVLADMKNLKVLSLTGNPVVRSTRDYRRVLLSRCSELTYLDQRPVNEKERLANDAWKKGGLEAERKFKEEWVKKEQQKIYNGVVAIMKMRDANLAKRGIDPSSVEDQIAAVEERGRELLEKYKEEIGGTENARDIIREQSKSNLDPLSNSLNMLLENEKLAVPDLDAEEVRDREAARERAKAIVAMNTMSAGSGDGTYESACITQEEVEIGREKCRPEVSVPMLEVVQNESDWKREEKAVNIDEAFKMPKREDPIADNLPAERPASPPPIQDENSRLIFHLEAMAKNFDYDEKEKDIDVGNNEWEKVDKGEENDTKLNVHEISYKGEEDNVSISRISNQNAEINQVSDVAIPEAKEENRDKKIVTRRAPDTLYELEYLEVGMDDDGDDDDAKSPRREKTGLIAIGSEIDKLFRSHSPNLQQPTMGTSRRMAWEEKPKQNKSRVLIEELN